MSSDKKITKIIDGWIFNFCFFFSGVMSFVKTRLFAEGGRAIYVYGDAYFVGVTDARPAPDDAVQ